MSHAVRRLGGIALLSLGAILLIGGSWGCKTEDAKGSVVYLPQTSEDNVMNNFQVAYRKREIEQYAKLLAPEFQFYLDPATRGTLGVDFWSRTEDSLRTEGLFNSTEVTKIAINLTWPPKSAKPANFLPPRDTWKILDLSDVFLDVDYAPVGQEVTTFRVEDQTQKFYFRKGRTSPPSGAGDTLVYIVEWHDQGTGANSVGELKAH